MHKWGGLRAAPNTWCMMRKWRPSVQPSMCMISSGSTTPGRRGEPVADVGNVSTTRDNSRFSYRSKQISEISGRGPASQL